MESLHDGSEDLGDELADNLSNEIGGREGMAWAFLRYRRTCQARLDTLGVLLHHNIPYNLVSRVNLHRDLHDLVARITRQQALDDLIERNAIE